MSASLKPLTFEEFLDWERSQPLRYEFDGIQPVAMTGATIAADRVPITSQRPQRRVTTEAASGRYARRGAVAEM